jgi:predicted lipoprotein with Yx(FWY)xxD motif
MTRTTTIAKLMIPLALTAALVAAFAAHSSTAGSMSKQLVVRTADNPTLHEKVLVNRKGSTLYSLSVEQRGKFICTDKACLSVWAPLVVAKGTTPTGAPNLGTVRRPDGRIQVSYRGRPLYTFSGDRKAGDVRGNGFKDVGVWRPASPGSGASAAAPAPNPYPGYGGYGGYGG